MIRKFWRVLQKMEMMIIYSDIVDHIIEHKSDSDFQWVKAQKEAADDAIFIADFTDEMPHRNRHDGIGGKEAELNQHRLNIG